MRIFLSYASERRAVAEALTLELRDLGHRVFLDRDDLPAGRAFDAQIRRQIEGSQLFLVLISPESIEKGRYTRTEISIAETLWPRPGGRVLPVVIAATPRERWPPYLRSLTALEPLEDVVAETVIAVERLSRSRRPGVFLRRVAAIAVAAAVVVTVVFLLVSDRKSRIPAEFEIYGNPPSASWRETVLLRLENIRPRAISSYSCRVEKAADAINIAHIEHDRRCEDIRVTLGEGPFVNSDGKARERLGTQRWERARLEVIDDRGAIAWSGEIRIGISNVMSWNHFSLAGLPGEEGRGTKRRYRPQLGREYLTRVEYRGQPLGDGFHCSATRPLISSVRAAELVPTGGCAFQLRPVARRPGARSGGGGEATIHIEHPASGWAMDLHLEFVFARS